MDISLQNNGEGSTTIHPLKFALWISLASISMMFAGFMSAYMVRQAAGNWFEFSLPSYFLASTLVILASSLTAHFTVVSFRKTREVYYKVGLGVTFLLGIVFVVLQYQGWLAMQSSGIDLKGNPSGAFVYLISGVHVAHVLAGLAAWTMALVQGFGLKFRPTYKRINRLEITAQYWHYVDLLWVVLFLFLTYYR
ncbi:MAG: cytochrome oxidase subunit III [Saprospiraceae bacterium]|nr:cytochrome oxidase subunit III [Saprospiraceae bacterium]